MAVQQPVTWKHPFRQPRKSARAPISYPEGAVVATDRIRALQAVAVRTRRLAGPANCPMPPGGGPPQSGWRRRNGQGCPVWLAHLSGALPQGPSVGPCRGHGLPFLRGSRLLATTNLRRSATQHRQMPDTVRVRLPTVSSPASWARVCKEDSCAPVPDATCGSTEGEQVVPGTGVSGDISWMRIQGGKSPSHPIRPTIDPTAAHRLALGRRLETTLQCCNRATGSSLNQPSQPGPTADLSGNAEQIGGHRTPSTPQPSPKINYGQLPSCTVDPG